MPVAVMHWSSAMVALGGWTSIINLGMTSERQWLSYWSRGLLDLIVELASMKSIGSGIGSAGPNSSSRVLLSRYCVASMWEELKACRSLGKAAYARLAPMYNCIGCNGVIGIRP
jgi:hypothetical protein